MPVVAATRRALGAEALGTAMLLLFGTGAVVVNEQTGALGHGGVAAAFGLVVMGLIQALGPVSGAHLNPAVTLGFWAAGRLPGSRVLPYLLAQLAGGLAGSGLLRLLAPASATLGGMQALRFGCRFQRHPDNSNQSAALLHTNLI